MFETLSGSRRSRPALAFSLGAHVLLAGLLTVPPLLATQEPPEPEEKIPPLVLPVDLGERSEEKPILLRKVREPERQARSASSEAPAPAKVEPTERKKDSSPSLTQPANVPLTVLTAPDDSPYSPFEEDSRSEWKGPTGLPGGNRNDTDGGPGGCEGCPPGSGIFFLGANVVAPVAIFTPEPQYPETARRARMSGWVAVEAIIESDGSVRDVRILRSSSPLFEASAIEAVHRWRYVAARIGSRAVPVYLTVNVTFTLRT